MGGGTRHQRDKRAIRVINTAFDRYTRSPPIPILKPKEIPTLILRQARLDIKTPQSKPLNQRTPLLTSSTKQTTPRPSPSPQLQLIQPIRNILPYPKPLPKSKGATLGAQQTKSGEEWGIQIGSFKAELVAQMAIESAANKISLLSHGTVEIIPADGPKGKIYRARLSGLTKNEVKYACEILNNANIPCTTVHNGAAKAI